jgi:hypothetical protein
MTAHLHLFFVAFLLPGACTLRVEGQNPGECSDGADNDADGLYDCDDPDCAGAPDCPEDTGEADADAALVNPQPSRNLGRG